MNINNKAWAQLLTAIMTTAMASASYADWNSNLLANPGAESAAGGNGDYVANLPGWNVSGELTGISYELGGPLGYPTTSDPGPSDRGANMFGGGYAGSSKGTQLIDLSFAQSQINGNGAHFDLSGWLGGYASQDDNAKLSVRFLDATNNTISSAVIGPVLASDRSNETAMLYRELAGWAPTNAKFAEVELLMSRNGGSANDGYADNLSFSLAQANALLAAPDSAKVGSSFDVTVSALSPFAGSYADDELLAFGFDLNYDHSLLQLTSINTVGSWDNDSGALANVDVAGSTFESISAAGQPAVGLATLSFTVLALGQANIDIFSQAAAELNQGLTYLNGNNVALYGRTQLALTAVPLPGSLVFLVSGISLLFGLRSRNRG